MTFNKFYLKKCTNVENYILQRIHLVKDSDIYYIARNCILSEDTLKKILKQIHPNKLDKSLYWLFRYQKMSESFLKKYIKKSSSSTYIQHQMYSDDFAKEMNINKSTVLASFKHFEGHKRLLIIGRATPNKISIGCFFGTKDEASISISKKYRAEDAQNYINSVYECFKIAQERIDKGDI